jgi:hypothetical protein
MQATHFGVDVYIICNFDGSYSIRPSMQETHFNADEYNP